VVRAGGGVEPSEGEIAANRGFIPSGRCPRAGDGLNLAGQERVSRKGGRLVGRMLGIVVAAVIGGLVLWLLIDRALFRFGAIGALIFGFVLVFLVIYLIDRRKVKEYEDFVAERERFD
jgi:phage shock protein PspC (stress-responsive transcriptional regulator)